MLPTTQPKREKNNYYYHKDPSIPYIFIPPPNNISRNKILSLENKTMISPFLRNLGFWWKIVCSHWENILEYFVKKYYFLISLN